MPRGICENCEQHDQFVHMAPPAFGRRAFVCVQCLSLLQFGQDDNAMLPNAPPHQSASRSLD